MSPRRVHKVASGSLADLRRAGPTDSTFENLLTLLRTELDLCSQLPVFEYEAASEGHDECAGDMHALAERERSNVKGLLSTLQRHLDRMPVSTPPGARS